MASFEFDSLDIPFLALFALFGVVTAGIGSIDLFGYSLGATFYEFVGFGFSYAAVGSFLSLLGIAATNELDPTAMELEQRALVGVAIGILVLQAGVPELNSAIVGSDLLGLGVFIVHAGAAASISYLG